MKIFNSFKTLINSLKSAITISDVELEILLSGCTLRTYPKKELLHKQGQVCNSVFFINSGLTRNYLSDIDGIEFTQHFSAEGDFVTDYLSYITMAPSHFAIQALTDTEVIIMPKSVILNCYKKINNANAFGRMITEQIAVKLSIELEKIKLKKWLDIYIELLEKYPDIHNCVPQHIIASYIGITPVHLSRLKARVAKHPEKH